MRLQEWVLILVVVEDVLVRDMFLSMALKMRGLNPCCGGRCSSTAEAAGDKKIAGLS